MTCCTLSFPNGSVVSVLPRLEECCLQPFKTDMYKNLWVAPLLNISSLLSSHYLTHNRQEYGERSLRSSGKGLDWLVKEVMHDLLYTLVPQRSRDRCATRTRRVLLVSIQNRYNLTVYTHWKLLVALLSNINSPLFIGQTNKRTKQTRFTTASSKCCEY